jgi:hypothetical protein
MALNSSRKRVYSTETCPIIRRLFSVGEREPRAFQPIQSVLPHPDMPPILAVLCLCWLCGDTIRPGIRRRYQDPDADGHVGQNYGGGEE